MRIASPRARLLSTVVPVLLLLAIAPANGQEERQSRALSIPAAGAVRIDADTEVTIAADGTSQTRHTSRITIRSEAGLQPASEQLVTHLDTVETLEVAEAYVQKADGRKIAVAPSAISVRAAGSQTGSGTSPAIITTAVAFSDLAVGDMLVLTTLRRHLQPPFAGHFAHSSVFPRGQPWGNATQIFVTPKGLALHVAMRGAAIAYASEPAGEGMRHRFKYSGGGSASSDEAGATAAIDREPGFAVSTFESYEEFGARYWQAASPRVVVGEQVRALADELTYGVAGKRQEAEAIDRWVKRYMRCTPAELARTPWPPANGEQLLERRTGDCRDLAALVMSLLEARGIRVEQALINLGASYALGRYPPGHLNHVILHLPEFGIYLDPSAPFTSFAVLPQELYDKPILLVSKDGVRQARTPPLAVEDHTLISRTRVAISADGSVSGSTTQTATGLFATALRALALRIQASRPEQAAEAILRAQRTPGTGTFELASPSELREPYTVKATFALNEKLAVPLRGNRKTPYGLPLHSRPGTVLLGPRLETRKEPYVCLAGRQTEEIEIEFAPELTLPRRLPLRSVDRPMFSYTTNNWLEGRTLKIKREFKSRVPGQVCEPGTAEDIAEDLGLVLANVGSMMSFGSQ